MPSFYWDFVAGAFLMAIAFPLLTLFPMMGLVVLIWAAAAFISGLYSSMDEKWKTPVKE